MRELNNKTLQKYLDNNLKDIETKCKNIIIKHKPKIVKFYNRYMGLFDAEKKLGHTNYTQNENVISLLNNEYRELNFEEYDEMLSLERILHDTKYIEDLEVLRCRDDLLINVREKINRYEVEFDKFHNALVKLNKRDISSSFGLFKYDEFENCKIEIYILSCFLFCKRYKIDVVKFVLTTYAHELAHAFNYLGQDKDGEKWAYDDFRDANETLIEGLAQYYAYEYAKDINISKSFDQEVLLRNQDTNRLVLSKVYREYKKYQKYGREHVYGALIYTRRNGITNFKDFRNLLEIYKKDLPSES